MHTIDPGTIECMLALALDALHASGIECVIEGDTPFRCAVGEPVPGIDPVQTEEAAVFVLPTNDVAVVVHPITGVSGESGWIAAVRPADQPFDDATLVTVAGVTQLIEDQTDRSLEQAQLAELGAVLRTNQDQLRSAHDRLEVSNGELEQFAYIAAHELVSPLRAVAIYAELLDTLASNLGGGMTDTPKLNPDAGEDSPIGAAAAAIRAGVAQMQEHVQQLLELTRVESDPTPFAPADLTQVAQRAIDTQSADIAAVGGSIELGLLSTVLGQPVHLQSVFANLISNAVRYRSPERPLDVTIRDASTDDAVVIVVTDNGIGVAAEDRQRVFAMFERGATQQPGFGIGLSLTRRILERHGAEISLDAAPVHGCAFTLRFARSAEAA